jgi:tRNA G10  N-methylase Trm11
MNIIHEHSDASVLLDFACLLGRQPELSIAELEQVYGSANVTRFSDDVAVVSSQQLDVQRLGGTVKAAKVIADIESADWSGVSRQLVRHYLETLKHFEGKLTLGISVYGKTVKPRDVQRTGLTLKQAMKKRGQSVRLIPNDDSALSSATSHHNKLGLSDNKREICVFYGPKNVLVTESVGTQNITALAKRDQGRPKRDAFVGMLPPKLALLMVNLSGVSELSDVRPHYILDPFCGTGVVLQEAALLGFDVYGSDLSEKMIDYSKQNMEWLAGMHEIGDARIEQGDAIEHRWDTSNLAAVVAETYLGQPFSAPPAQDKLDKVTRICNEIITKFLKNLGSQLESGTPLCVAVPAWRDSAGHMTHLPLTKNIQALGYDWQTLEHADVERLAYFREDQVVARQLLILRKT